MPGSGMPYVPAHAEVPTDANWNCATQCAYMYFFWSAVRSDWMPPALAATPAGTWSVPGVEGSSGQLITNSCSGHVVLVLPSPSRRPSRMFLMYSSYGVSW